MALLACPKCMVSNFVPGYAASNIRRYSGIAPRRSISARQTCCGVLSLTSASSLPSIARISSRDNTGKSGRADSSPNSKAFRM